MNFVGASNKQYEQRKQQRQAATKQEVPKEPKQKRAEGEEGEKLLVFLWQVKVYYVFLNHVGL